MLFFIGREYASLRPNSKVSLRLGVFVAQNNLHQSMIASMPDTLKIEVIYCPKGSAPLSRKLRVPVGCTAGQAITQSSLLTESSLLRKDPLQIGIYGKQCTPETELHHLDRVEIYRALRLSPTEARRLRAQTLAVK